jgi:hypothetical protein
VTYREKVGSVLAASNQVGYRLGSVAARLGNDSAVDRLGRRGSLFGVLGDLDTTRSSLNTNSLKNTNISKVQRALTRNPVYLVVSNTGVLERMEVGQVVRFRRELETFTLHKEGVVVLD